MCFWNEGFKSLQTQRSLELLVSEEINNRIYDRMTQRKDIPNYLSDSIVGDIRLKRG